MEGSNKPFYNTSRAEAFLNFIVGSSDTYPTDAPQSRLEAYLKFIVGDTDTYPTDIPQSRLEEYMQYICAHMGGGGSGISEQEMLETMSLADSIHDGTELQEDDYSQETLDKIYLLCNRITGEVA